LVAITRSQDSTRIEGVKPRPAQTTDVAEVIRLARVMFDSIGADSLDSTWEEQGHRQIHARLGKDLGIFVVDHPDDPRQLIASAAGTIALRLPSPFNPAGRVGYIQWVCTDPAYRGQGLARKVMTSLLDWYEEGDVPSIELHATPMAESIYRALDFDYVGPRAMRRRRS
jgi:GNAT superfamily N-acetyltransferase